MAGKLMLYKKNVRVTWESTQRTSKHHGCMQYHKALIFGGAAYFAWPYISWISLHSQNYFHWNIMSNIKTTEPQQPIIARILFMKSVFGWLVKYIAHEICGLQYIHRNWTFLNKAMSCAYHTCMCHKLELISWLASTASIAMYWSF